MAVAAATGRWEVTDARSMIVAIFGFYAAFAAYHVLRQKAAWEGAPAVRGLDWPSQQR